MPKVNCNNCNISFDAKPYHIRLGQGKYCSSTCQYKGAMNGKNLECEICDKKIYRTRGQLNRTKSGKMFCGKSCQAKWRNKVYSGPRHKLWNGGASVYKRVMKNKNELKICKFCRIEDKRVMAIHHIDKNHMNNDPDNLVWLCHNCHYLVHHDRLEAQKIMEVLV